MSRSFSCLIVVERRQHSRCLSIMSCRWLWNATGRLVSRGDGVVASRSNLTRHRRLLLLRETRSGARQRADGRAAATTSEQKRDGARFEIRPQARGFLRSSPQRRRRRDATLRSRDARAHRRALVCCQSVGKTRRARVVGLHDSPRMSPVDCSLAAHLLLAACRLSVCLFVGCSLSVSCRLQLVCCLLSAFARLRFYTC